MTIEHARIEIDKLDDEIVAAFCQRLQLCQEIGQEKQRLGLSVCVAQREQAVISRLTEGLNVRQKSAVESLYATIFDISKQLQAEVGEKE